MESTFNLTGINFSLDTSNNTIVIEYINSLEAFKTKFKNLHWSAINNSMHIRVDEFLSILSDYQDIIAEDNQGIYGKFGPNDIKTINLDYEDPSSAIKALLIKVTTFHKNFKDNESFIGMINATEDFIQEINKYMYLFKLCLKE